MSFDEFVTEWRKQRIKIIVASGESYKESDVYCPHCGAIDYDYWDRNLRREEWMSNDCEKCEESYEFMIESVFSSRKKK